MLCNLALLGNYAKKRFRKSALKIGHENKVCIQPKKT